MMRGGCPVSALFAALLCLLGSAAALAQTDLTGDWGGSNNVDYQDFQLRGAGPDPLDYAGMPINADARAVAVAHSAEEQALPQRQCLPYPPPYTLTSPAGLRMWPDYDATGRVIAWNTSAGADVAGLKIWMDGRPHPSQYADHPLGGFTTGVWEGDILTTYTTHMKHGYLRRNGVPESDQATMTLHFIRHGTLLTIAGELNDPIYLTRAFLYSRVRLLVRTPTEASDQFDPASSGVGGKSACRATVEGAKFADVGTVPHYLPGTNPSLGDLAARLHLPQFATMGGEETIYPEFRKRLQGYKAPAKCERICCGWEGFGAAANTLPGCPTDFVFKKPIPYIPDPPITP
jgi:hypothetical protein